MMLCMLLLKNYDIIIGIKCLQLILIWISQMYELSQRKNNQFGQPLLTNEPQIIVKNINRGCTDLICLILFIMFSFAFIGFMEYGLVDGDARRVFSVYNPDQIRCSSTSDFKYGYFPDQDSFTNATCVSQCPASNLTTVSCLVDNVTCLTGTFSNTYQSFSFDFFCLPDGSVAGRQISDYFSYSAISQWAYDIYEGWMVLVASAGAAIFLSLVFLLLIRICTVGIMWTVIGIIIFGTEIVGILFILQAKGIHIGSIVTDVTSGIEYNVLIIVGSCLIGFGVLIALLVACLSTRIMLGCRSVQLASIFICQNCCMVILPITQAIFVVATIVAMVVGGVTIFSMGQLDLSGGRAFPIVHLSVAQIIYISICLFGGLWTLFYFHGANQFIISSAVPIWYFNHENKTQQNSPFCDSFGRLIRFHSGSVAIIALIHGLLFVLKIICNIFTFTPQQDDIAPVKACLTCLNFLFFIFKIFLRFLSNGTLTMVAVEAEGFCKSTFRAYNLITDHGLKLTITGAISLLFTLMGILGIAVGVGVGAYFAVEEIDYLASRISEPVVITVVSGLIALSVAAIYLSLIDICAQGVMICYLLDYEHGNGKLTYTKETFRNLLQDTE